MFIVILVLLSLVASIIVGFDNGAKGSKNKYPSLLALLIWLVAVIYGFLTLELGMAVIALFISIIVMMIPFYIFKAKYDKDKADGQK